MLGRRAKLTERSSIEINGSRNRVSIGRRSGGCLRVRFQTDGAALEVGDACTVVDAVFSLHEPRRIVVGRGCMLSAGIWISVSDMHTLVDLDTGERLNPPEDVVIGDRVWLGYESKILKGAEIGSGSIIATAAVVTGRIPPNCMAAGIPARVVRERVSWRRPLLGIAAWATSDVDLKR